MDDTAAAAANAPVSTTTPDTAPPVSNAGGFQIPIKIQLEHGISNDTMHKALKVMLIIIGVLFGVKLLGMFIQYLLDVKK
jgi:hypothetical protein